MRDVRVRACVCLLECMNVCCHVLHARTLILSGEEIVFSVGFHNRTRRQDAKLHNALAKPEKRTTHPHHGGDTQHATQHTRVANTLNTVTRICALCVCMCVCACINACVLNLFHFGRRGRRRRRLCMHVLCLYRRRQQQKLYGNNPHGGRILQLSAAAGLAAVRCAIFLLLLGLANADGRKRSGRREIWGAFALRTVCVCSRTYTIE